MERKRKTAQEQLKELELLEDLLKAETAEKREKVKESYAKRKAIIDRRKKRVEQRRNTETRVHRNHRLVLLGTLVEHLLSGGGEKAQELRQEMNAFFQRSKDRKFLGLDSDES